MQYVGSRNRISKDILPIILKNRKEGQCYVEPFCGGANLIDKVTGWRIGNDLNGYVIACHRAIQQGWTPPTNVSEEMYKAIRDCKEAYLPHLVGFVGVCCAFGANWFHGYARNAKGSNYADVGSRHLLRQRDGLLGIDFYSVSYEHLYIPPQSIIYCDPPYEGVTGYGGKFDHERFWQWCREKSGEGHEVFISEYKAPQDFIEVWSKEINCNLNNQTTDKEIKRVEKLFIYNDLW